MTLDNNQLINKSYFESFLGETETAHPIRVLGEAYLEEQKNEMYDLSHIRYAQGEIYFHNKDYEAAIFKWENITNELEPWAKKNIADSYFELGLLSAAEDIYTNVQTDSNTLAVEVSLQLFALYIEREKFDQAYKVISKAISLSPDYPNVTALARAFYEERQDWNSATKLAVDEMTRTESLKWFDHLHRYVEQGYTKSFSPDYFYLALTTLYKVDQQHFEQLTSALWYSYKNQDTYLFWVKTINELFLNIDVNTNESWKEIAAIYQETYFELTDGRHLINELHEVLPQVLENWLKVTNSDDTLFASAAVLAWNELFPSSVEINSVREAQKVIYQAKHDQDSLGHSLQLFDSITKWTEKNKLEIGFKTKWWMNQLTEFRMNSYLVTGFVGSEKSSFINSVLGEKLVDDSTLVVLSDDDTFEMNEISTFGSREISNISDYQEQAAQNGTTGFLNLKRPCIFLNEIESTLINTPEFTGLSNEQNETYEYLPLADGVLFVLDANDPFTDKERQVLLKMKEKSPNVPIHFLLNKLDSIFDETDAIRVVEETRTRIRSYFPDAQVLPYSLSHPVSQQLNNLTSFFKSNFQVYDHHDKNISKILFLIRITLSNLLKKRVQLESSLIDSIKWNEDILVRLNGFHHGLGDLESEKIKVVTDSYRRIKTEMKDDLAKSIPKMLKDCSELIKEDSDFSKLHVELNEKMNEKVQRYVQHELIPEAYRALSAWIEMSNEELANSQYYLDEMSETFNGLYEQEKLKLVCDFKVLDDWRRDINRMTSRVQVEKENILLRANPAQFLLKSAGKLFGSLTQNKSMLYNQYKKYVEHENYEDVTEAIVNKFFLQFDMFEKALQSDITIFFKEPFHQLNKIITETQTEIEESQQALKKMKTNPEAYYDPIKLFELKLQQYEFIVKASKEAVFSGSKV